MTIKDNQPGQPADQAAQLRARAETTLQGSIARTPAREIATLEETQRLLHELRVHQIELEMQNEELRRTQVELDATRERYFDLYDLAPVGYIIVGETGLILEANLVAATLLGVPRGNLVSLPLSTFIHKKSQDSYYLHRKQLVETGAPQAFELHLAKQDGTVFWAHLEATLAHNRASGPGPDGTSRPVLNIVISNINEHKQLEDITERKRAVEALFESEEKFRDLFNNAEVAMFRSRLDGSEVLDVNRKFLELVGKTREETLGQPSALLWVDPEAREEMARRLVADGSVSEFEFQILNQRRGVRDCVTSLRLYPDQGILVGSIDDITERKRFAEEKARLEDQLRQAQKVEAIGRLAGGVAHDFNNITAIVLGYGEMLLGRLGPEDPSRKYVEQIVAAGRRSSMLTRQLLAFGRRQTLLPEVLDLNALLRNLDRMLGRLIGEDIRLDFKLAAELGCITADAGQLEQVVTNLVVNARDAMPKGGRLVVETSEVELDQLFLQSHANVVPGWYVLLALTDTGCGMDQAALARLFEPFYTTKERGKGTGLGLATAYGIVKQSGGYIWATSEPGVGTTFKIYLPRTDAQPLAKSAEAAAAAPRGSGELILLAEDEAPLRELCATVLAQLGYRVSAAANGPEALRQVLGQGLAPDLVLTDVIMPGMSGAQLAQRLRRERPGLKVLYMSGYPDGAIAPHGVLAPGTHFIQKPFTERAIAVKIREALGTQALGKEPGAAGHTAKEETGSAENETAAAQTVSAEKTAARTAASVAPTGRRILMIDDDEQYRELVRHFCTKRGHVFAGADSAAAALAALAGSAFDVLLVDLNIPGTSGEQVLREIRAAGHAAPAIVLTGDVAAADMDALRSLGAVSALEKSSNAQPLLQAIDAATG